MENEPTGCPYCGSKVTRASRLRNQYPHDAYTTPTQYLCGTVSSEHWAPPVAGRECPAYTNPYPLPEHLEKTKIRK